MTDNEYAVLIYCQVFNKTTDNGDAHVRGILDAISALEPREQTALGRRYRDGKTLAQIGQDIGGVSASAARSVVTKAMLKLRHPYRHRKMSVALIIKDRDKLPVKLASARKWSIYDLGLPQRVINHLICEEINTIDALLELDNLDRLTVRYGFGKKSRDELISKMCEQGYPEWADKMAL